MDLIKYDMTDIWAVAGDVIAPDSAKVRAGWGVEVVPRQWWNWFENRQDQNIAYMLQKSFAEWDSTTEYIINKSYVQRSGIVYRATATSTNSDPIALTSWVKAFVDSTPYLEAIKGLAVTPNTQSYIDGSGVAQNTASSALGRQIGNVADAAAARTLISAQLAHANLTGLSSVSGSSNNLPYFTGSGNMAVTTFTGFARSLLDDADAAAMRTTLGVYSVAESDSALTAGLATRQPLATNLTNLAALTITANTIAYYNASSILGLTPATTYGRGFLNLADAVSSRTYIGSDNAANLTTGLLDLARLPATLTGKNAATATALQTPRTIQGVTFDGTANITLAVVDKDSGVGSAVMPVGTTAQRTASPSNGMLRYNSETNEFEGYQNGGWAGIGGGTPLHTVLWWPSRASIPAGYLPADGQLLTRTTYQAAFGNVDSGILPVVSDTTWLANSTSRASYSTGDGSTTFRIPDLNGKSAGTVAAPFLRGDGTNSTGIAGQFQADQFQHHNHASFWSNTQQMSGGVGTLIDNKGTSTALVQETNRVGAPITSVIGGSVKTGTETRPVNVTGVFVIKLIGGASELSQEDASVAVAALEEKLLYVGGRNRIINGAARVNQYGPVSFTNNTNGYGGPDRFFATNSAAGGAFTQGPGTIDVVGVSKAAVKQTVTSPLTTSTGTSQWSGITQIVEGVNCYDMLGAPVTVSFNFLSNVSGTFGVSLRDSGVVQSYVTTFTATANVVERVEITIPALPLNLALNPDNLSGLRLGIGAYTTGSLVAPSLNGWIAGNYLAASGIVNWAATNGNYISATDIQLEVGTKATAFETKDYSTEFASCRRYYQNLSNPVYYTTYAAGAGTGFVNRLPFSTRMRATPTMSQAGLSSGNVSSSSVGGDSPDAFRFSVTNTSPGNVIHAVGTIIASAELL